MFKKIKKFSALALALVAFTACGSNSDDTQSANSTQTQNTDTTDSTDDVGKQATDVDLAAELEKEPTGDKIVLISNNGSDGREEFILDKLKAKGFNVEFVSVGGADAAARVISEVENPTTNVIWGPAQFNFDDMIAAGSLAAWEPTWADKVGTANRENGYSYPYEAQPKLWLANKDEFKEANLPKTIQELISDKKYKGKYLVPTNFGGTTNRAIVASILGQYMDESGELGVSQEGWDMMKAYIDNGIRQVEGQDKFVNLSDGTVPIIFEGASNTVTNIEDGTIDPVIFYFENGQPSNSNEIGVVNSNDPAKLAESVRLANYLGSAEFLSEFAGKFGNIVVNEDAKASMVPTAKEISDKYEEQELDWDKINKLLDDWIAKIELEFL